MTKKHTRLTLQSPFVGRHLATMVFSAAFAAFAVTPRPVLSAQAPASNFPMSQGSFNAPVQQLSLPAIPQAVPITPNGTVVEDLVARVNDQIITRSEYERAEQGLLQEAQQQNAPESVLQDRLHNLLRDMIDKQLLLSKGKTLGVNCDADVIRQLDEIRKSNHLDSMEALEKAAASQGISFEDFKQQIRDSCTTQKVVSEEVGRRLNMTHTQEAAYYTAHAKEFQVPEQVHLSEILITTPDNATEAQIAAAKVKADAVEAKLKAGAKFADVAKADSQGPTASAGGDLGDFKHGALGSDLLENATFPLPVGGDTAPIRTRQGFVILHVDAHQAAGIPPLDAVMTQVQNALYVEQMAPALRAYLTKSRDDAYVDVAPGFVDSGSARKSGRSSDIAYTAYKAPPEKKKVVVKQRVEQEKANKAQADLAAAREKVAEKEAAKSAPVGTRVSGASKPRKIRKEKIRYGQAPRDSLPAGTTATVAVAGAPLTGQAPGVAMAPTESVTTITTGVGADNDPEVADTHAGPVKKTRFSAHESDAEEASAKAHLAKAEVKATTRPLAATRTETDSEKVQAAPLGLNGDTTKKPKKAKRKKGEAKERMQAAPAKPVDTSVPVAPTVNPTLAKPAVDTTTPKSDSNGADRTTLPPASTNSPGAVTQGQPTPAVATPGSATTPSPDPPQQ
jgi:peptidyl-prolyl cis-trans isomerase SurA